MNRDHIVGLIKMILRKQGNENELTDENVRLIEIGFRSLDFSELCLRVEEETGKELDFQAVILRNVETVKDICDFIVNSINH